MVIHFGRGNAASFSSRSGTKAQYEEQKGMLLEMLEYLLAAYQIGDEQIPQKLWEELALAADRLRISLSPR